MTSKNQWLFTPSLGASILFLVLFFLTTLVHLAQAILYRNRYGAVIVLSALVQTLTYIFRTLSIQNPYSFSDYVVWFVLILVAPLLTNAFVYMVFGRMVWKYAEKQRIGKIKAWNFGTIFVLLDILALLIQVYGAGTAATSFGDTEGSASKALKGLHIYMAGVGFQQFFILIFCAFAIPLFYHIQRNQIGPARSRALMLLYTLLIVLVLITIRIIFRICEYSQGFSSTIPNHEAYQYCLDSLPMLIALVLFNVVHPARILNDGQGSNMPGFRERRRGLKLNSESRIELSSS